MNAVAKWDFQQRASTGPAFYLLCSFSAKDRKYCFWAQSFKHLTITAGLFCFVLRTEILKIHLSVTKLICQFTHAACHCLNHFL